MSLQTIRVSETADRVTVELHRPDARNAIDQRMITELHGVCSRLEENPRVLILRGAAADADTGAKAVFASGADIGQLRERRRDDALAGINSTLFARVAALPMPVIAVLDGFALGGGAELAYAADFRIGTPGLRLGNPETGLGILAAAGATWRLRELVGEPLAKEILLGGRVLTGQECLDAGLITRMVEPDGLDDAVDALVGTITAQDPLAVRLTKAVFAAPRSSHPLIDTLAQGILFESPGKFDRMQQFLDRRGSR